MNLYTYIQNLENEITQEQVDAIRSSLEERQFDLEMQEPMSDGVTHDNWEEKYEEINTILDAVGTLEDLLVNEADETQIKEAILDLQSEVDMYQLFYGGLKRHKINI